jgi:cell division protein FtsB
MRSTTRKITHLLEALFFIGVEIFLIYIVINGWLVNCKLRGYEETLKLECCLLEDKIKILEEEIKLLKESEYKIEEEARLQGMVKEGEEIIKFIPQGTTFASHISPKN